MGGNGEEEWRGEEERRSKKKKEDAVAFIEMLIDGVNSMRNKPPLSPVINYTHTHTSSSTTTTHLQTCASVKRCV